jgi:hypothetical protein
VVPLQELMQHDAIDEAAEPYAEQEAGGLDAAGSPHGTFVSRHPVRRTRSEPAPHAMREIYGPNPARRGVTASSALSGGLHTSRSARQAASM